MMYSDVQSPLYVLGNVGYTQRAEVGMFWSRPDLSVLAVCGRSGYYARCVDAQAESGFHIVVM